MPQVCPTGAAAVLGVLWVIGTQCLGLFISLFLAEILEGSCIHFHLYFVEKYVKKTKTHRVTTAECMQMLPESPGLGLADVIWDSSSA